MGCKLSPQSHFTCLFHDHAKCSCIGGPRRLVQSHFTCHSHEWSSSLFFVMHVHCTYTSIRVSCMPSCLLHTAWAVLCLHRSLSSVSCCSSVSVSTDVIRRNVFLTYKAISRLRALVDFTSDCHNIWFPLDEHSIYADRHVGILALLLSSAYLRLAYTRRVSWC